MMIIDCYYGDICDRVSMSMDELSDWIYYGYAYDEYDRLMVDGVDARDLID
jgi:hypothetical protein